MGLLRFFGLILVALVALAVYAAYSPASIDAFAPAAGPLAHQLSETLGAATSSAGSLAPAAAQNPPPRPPVSVLVGRAERQDFAWRLDEIGAAQPVASVALRAHADATVQQVLVSDGAAVKAGEILIRLDARQAEAQLKGAEAQLAKDQAQLEQAQRDVQRYIDLVSRSATPVLNLDNAKTAVASTQASILADQAAIENLKVQLGWYTVKAPIAGRIGAVTIKAGNIAKAGDNSSAGVFATINQVSPIYVAFSSPQALLPALREAMANGAEVIATPQGAKKSTKGKIALIENSIDGATGSIIARAAFDNSDELLWPGQLCNLRITLKIEPDTVVIPREAVQVSQQGNFVFTIVDGAAHIQPVEVSRTLDGLTKVDKGLSGGETVVIDGQLLLIEGSMVEIRDAKKGAS